MILLRLSRGSNVWSPLRTTFLPPKTLVVNCGHTNPPLGEALCTHLTAQKAAERRNRNTVTFAQEPEDVCLKRQTFICLFSPKIDLFKPICKISKETYALNGNDWKV